jgi:MFS family permease
MSSGAAPPSSAEEAPAEIRIRWTVLVVLLAAPFMAVLDAFVVIIAVPSIQEQLQASDAGAQLIVTGYVVAYAAGLIAGGRLGDAYGRRRLLVIGLSLFSATSLAAAAAPNQTVLVVARLLQGGAAALMYPQALASVRVHYGAGTDFARAMAIWGVALGSSSALAQLVGAAVIEANLGGLGWRAVFAINVPLGLVTAALTRVVVPESRSDAPIGVGAVSVVLLTVGLLGLVLPVTVGRELGWPRWTWPALLAALVLGLLFVVREQRLGRTGRMPLIDLGLLGAPPFRFGLAAMLALYGGQLSLWTLLSVYLQHGLHLSPVGAGIMTFPVAVGFLLSSTIASRLSGPVPTPVVTGTAAGLAASTAGLAVVVLSNDGHSLVFVMMPLLALVGAGFGVVIPALAVAVLAVVPRGGEGVASGVLVTAQQVAGAIGVALAGAVFFGLLPRLPYGAAFAFTLVLNVVLFALAAVLAMGVRR